MSKSREETGTIIKEKEEQKTQKPSLYNVFILNDDYTTMDFVVDVLMGIFHKNRTEATQIMLHVHQRGMGLCGVYPREIAETKVDAVHSLAQKYEFPLRCMIEKE